MSNNVYSVLENKFFTRRKEEKKEFLDFIEEELKNLNWETDTISGKPSFINWGGSKNLVTKSQKPKFIILAHYDTPKTIPGYYTFFSKLVGVNYGKGLFFLVLLLLPGIITLIFNSIFKINLGYEGVLFILCVLSLFHYISQKTNPINFNDNTSGVIAMLLLAEKFAQIGINKEEIMLVFTDNEEKGLLGAKVLKKDLRNQNVSLEHTKVINLDCIGNGSTLMLGYINKKSKEFAEIIKTYIDTNEFDVESLLLKSKSSDHKVFKREGAIHFAYVEKPLLFKGYYYKNYHSPDDSYINKDSLELLIEIISSYVKESLNY